MSMKAASNSKVAIDVYATEDEDGTVKFDSHWRHENGKPGVWKSGRIDLPPGKVAYDLEFKLHDKSGKKLKFLGADTNPPQPDEAMYCQVGGNCPPAKGNGGNQIQFVDVQDNKLDVTDLNKGAGCVLKYMLRFDGDASSVGGKSFPPYEYDPEIRNGGGN